MQMQQHHFASRAPHGRGMDPLWELTGYFTKLTMDYTVPESGEHNVTGHGKS